LSCKFLSSLSTKSEKSLSFESAPVLLEIELFNSDLAFSKLAFFCFNLDFEIDTDVSVSLTLSKKGF